MRWLPLPVFAKPRFGEVAEALASRWGRDRTPAKPAFLEPCRLLPDALATAHGPWFAGLSQAEQLDVLDWLTAAAQARLRNDMANPYAPVAGLGVVITAHLRSARQALEVPEASPNRFDGLTYTAQQAADRTGLAPTVPPLDAPAPVHEPPLPPTTYPTYAPVTGSPTHVRASYPTSPSTAQLLAIVEAGLDAEKGGTFTLCPYLPSGPRNEADNAPAPRVNPPLADGPLTMFLDGDALEDTGQLVPIPSRYPRSRPRSNDLEHAPTEDLSTPSETSRHVVLRSAPLPLAYDDSRGNQQAFQRLVETLERGLTLQPFPEPTVMGQLRAEFPWAKNALASLDETLTLGRYVGQPHVHLPPLLLVGPPGSGKTRLAQRLGEVLGQATWVFSAAGRFSGQAFLGMERQWSNAQASSLIQFMAHRDAGNPLVVLDELDKASTEGTAGTLADALLPLLERQSATRINDVYLMADLDLSQVSWVATANDLGNLPAALLSRFTVIHLGRPQRTHVPAMVDAVRADLASELGVAMDALPSWDEADTQQLVQCLPSAFSAREVSKAVRQQLVQRARGARLTLVPPSV